MGRVNITEITFFLYFQDFNIIAELLYEQFIAWKNEHIRLVNELLNNKSDCTCSI